MKLLGTVLADRLERLAVEVRAAADLSAGPVGIKAVGADAPTELTACREEKTCGSVGIRLVSSQTHKRMPSRRYGVASPGDGIHLSVVGGRDHDSSRSLDVRRGVK